MSAAAAAPYERLVASFEQELELIGEGRLEELDALAADRAALIERLPPTPPAAAGDALARAALMSKRVMVEIVRRRDAVLLELGRLAKVERTARGYAPRRSRRRHIDASA